MGRINVISIIFEGPFPQRIKLIHIIDITQLRPIHVSDDIDVMIDPITAGRPTSSLQNYSEEQAQDER